MIDANTLRGRYTKGELDYVYAMRYLVLPSSAAAKKSASSWRKQFTEVSYAFKSFTTLFPCKRIYKGIV